VFPGNLQAHEKRENIKGHGLWASLKSSRGIGGQKFICRCHNTAARQHNSTAPQVGQHLFYPGVTYESWVVYLIYR